MMRLEMRVKELEIQREYEHKLQDQEEEICEKERKLQRKREEENERRQQENVELDDSESLGGKCRKTLHSAADTVANVAG